jgi:HK97 family phage major capsid protein
MSKELEEKLVKDAASALNEIKDTLQKQMKDGDALLAEKFDKCANQVADTIEGLQKLKLADEAKAKQLNDIEAAVSRVGTQGQKGESAESIARKEALDLFIRKGAMKGTAGGQVKLGDFIEQFAESKGLEMKALSVNNDADGGFLVLPEFGGVVTTQIFETSPIRLYADSVTIGTDSYEYVDDYNEASAGWVAETEARSATNTPQVGKRIIPTHEIYANPQATQKVLEDSVVNMESWLAGKVADKFARLENTAFVAGDGVGKPRGFTTYAAGSSTYTPGSIEQVNGGGTASYTYNGLVNAMGALKTDYLQGAVWAGARASLTLLLQVKDAELRPIFNMTYDKNNRTFGSMLGLPVAIFNDMPAPTSANLALAVGDFKKAYKIVDRRGINILRDPFTNKPYVGFYTTKRVGGDVVNFEAIKLVKMST